jgi:hypothetical protein
MVRFVGDQNVIFVEEAVLALPFGPFSNQSTKTRRHRFAHGVEAFRDRRRALTNRINISACSY